MAAGSPLQSDWKPPAFPLPLDAETIAMLAKVAGKPDATEELRELLEAQDASAGFVAFVDDETPGLAEQRKQIREIGGMAHRLQNALFLGGMTPNLIAYHLPPEPPPPRAPLRAVRESISNLSAACKDALAELPKSGPRYLYGLRLACFTIAIAYEEFAGEMFTYDVHHGELVTPGARFVALAAPRYFPAATPQQLATAMRWVVKGLAGRKIQGSQCS